MELWIKEDVLIVAGFTYELPADGCVHVVVTDGKVYMNGEEVQKVAKKGG